ncbi:MAG TPA: ElyC/SanA/YdcF family protein [Oceanobacillus sp.]|nr:ElyC/SanA/YdcF family protein [Oceanobacillus sp.]
MVAKIRRLLIIGIGLFMLAILGIAFLRGFSAVQASGYIYSLDAVPERPVAIVFGAQVFPSGRLSAMLADRVRLGAELYRSGKVQALLFTGDNSEVTYNEPEAMRRYALELGIPDEAITLDYAGFSTYDSCYRARDIFLVNQAILVTQDFHLDRALLICNALGVDSVGVAADVMRPTGYARRSLLMSELREFPATALAVFDLVRHDLPTYLGDPLPIVDT